MVVRLLGIGNNEMMLLGQFIHARAGRELLPCLRASVQHDDEGNWLSGSIVYRGIHKIRETTSGTGVDILLPHRTIEASSRLQLSLLIITRAGWKRPVA